MLFSVWVGLRSRRWRAVATARKAAAPIAHEDGEHIAALAAQLETVARRLDVAEAHGRRAIQRIGIVRYNPFADTGSNQSFVLAVLDARGNGFVLSSLHSRQQSRVFLKPVVGGRSETAVSEEEAEAIRQATGAEAAS